MAVKKSKSGQTESFNIYNFNPDQIAELIARRDWTGCWDYLSQVVENLTMNAGASAIDFIMKLQKDMEDERQKQYVSDFGGLLGELFIYLLTEENAFLSDKSFQSLIFYHETIHSLFYIYDLDNTDDAVRQIIARNPRKITASDQKKILVLLSLDTDMDMVALLKSVDPEYRASAVTSYLGYRKIFRKNVYENKIKLYELRKELENANSDIKTLLYAATTYFQCSYLALPEKHIIKENINVAFRKFIASKSRDFRRIDNAPAGNSSFIIDKSKPTVLVMAEIFAKNHAMYRCWGARTEAIQRDFNVVFVTPAASPATGLEEDYKNIVKVGNVGDLYQVAHETQPDMIFMPSVGMRFFSIILANMRVAPIQIMGLGHPATTMSDCVDYVVGPSYIYDEAAFPRDQYVADGYDGKYIPLVSKEKFFEPVERDAPRTGKNGKRVISVAVVGTDIKVSYPFFTLLKEIIAESDFDIHVHFLMGVGGIDSLYIEKYLRENFTEFTFHGFQPYERYLSSLKRVDVVLNSFPFGHTNTIIDTLLCGKPCVGLDGVEPSAKSEGDVLRAVDLVDDFVAKDEADYKRKFFAIADKIQNGQTEFFDRDMVYERLFSTENATSDWDYGKVMRWIYDNNDKLKASGKRYFEVFEDVQAL